MTLRHRWQRHPIWMEGILGPARGIGRNIAAKSLERPVIADDVLVVVPLPKRRDAPAWKWPEAGGKKGPACRSRTRIVIDGLCNGGLEGSDKSWDRSNHRRPEPLDPPGRGTACRARWITASRQNDDAVNVVGQDDKGVQVSSRKVRRDRLPAIRDDPAHWRQANFASFDVRKQTPPIARTDGDEVSPRLRIVVVTESDRSPSAALRTRNHDNGLSSPGTTRSIRSSPQPSNGSRSCTP